MQMYKHSSVQTVKRCSLHDRAAIDTKERDMESKKEYIVNFELYLHSYPTVDWTSVLHFTKSGNIETYGDRNPAVQISGHKDHYRLIHISSSIDGNKNMWIDPKKIYPLKTWINIRISQTLIDNKVLTSGV